MLLFYSGGGAKEIKESDAAKEFWERFRRAFGIEDGKLEVLYERDSLNTEENAAYTKMIFQNKGVEEPKIALVTAGWHIKRAKMAFEAQGFSVLAKSTEAIKGGNTATKKEYTFMSYLPNVDALRINREIFRDILGRTKIWLFGLQG